MDHISLTGIEVWAFHGVLPHESELGQRFLVDATIGLDLTGAAVDDDLAATVDYGALAAVVDASVAEPRALLLEAVAERTAAAVLAFDDRIEVVDITLHKPGAPMTVPVRDVAVSLTRRRATDHGEDPDAST